MVAQANKVSPNLLLGASFTNDYILPNVFVDEAKEVRLTKLMLPKNSISRIVVQEHS